MSTGTIRDAAEMFFIDIKNDEITVSFVNDSGEELVQGQEVTIKPDGTIEKRTTEDEVLLGVVVVGAKDGLRATINVFASYTAEGEAGDDLVPGDYAFQNGTTGSTGTIVYKKSTAGKQSAAIVMKGGLTGSKVKVIILKSTRTA